MDKRKPHLLGITVNGNPLPKGNNIINAVLSVEGPTETTPQKSGYDYTNSRVSRIIILQREAAFIDRKLSPHINFIGTVHLETCLFLRIYNNTQTYCAHIDRFTKLDPKAIIDLFDDKTNLSLELIGTPVGDKNEVALETAKKTIIDTLIVLDEYLKSNNLSISISATCLLSHNRYKISEKDKIKSKIAPYLQHPDVTTKKTLTENQVLEAIKKNASVNNRYLSELAVNLIDGKYFHIVGDDGELELSCFPSLTYVDPLGIRLLRVRTGSLNQALHMVHNSKEPSNTINIVFPEELHKRLAISASMYSSKFDGAADKAIDAVFKIDHPNLNKVSNPEFIEQIKLGLQQFTAWAEKRAIPKTIATAPLPATETSPTLFKPAATTEQSVANTAHTTSLSSNATLAPIMPASTETPQPTSSQNKPT